MRILRLSIIARLFALVAITLFIFPLAEMSAQGNSDTSADFKIKALKYFVPGHRIQMDVQVTDPDGVSQVRCYFRAQSQKSFLFVQMKSLGGSRYSGILPAPSRETPYIEYLYLAVNGVNQVTKTQTLVVEQKDDDETPAWQEVSSEGDVNVYTELAEAPETIAGFSDSIVTDVVVSSSRFGFTTTGIYTASEISGAGGAAGAAATSTSSGTAGVSAGGLSTGAIVGISAAAAAVVAGTAYAVTKDDDDDPPNNDEEIFGLWEGATDFDCSGYDPMPEQLEFREDHSVLCSHGLTGTWSLNDHTVNFNLTDGSGNEYYTGSVNSTWTRMEGTVSYDGTSETGCWYANKI